MRKKKEKLYLFNLLSVILIQKSMRKDNVGSYKKQWLDGGKKNNGFIFV